MRKLGTVFLVGAGPGDPELLTLKGRRILAQAEVVLYDSLVNPEILDFADRAGVRKVFVGKRPGQGHPKQQRINLLLKRMAGQHKTVVRLKGGDPFLLSRGGEEALFLRRHGIPFEVVPGITSALAVPAYAGVPLTTRGLSSMVTIVSGHNRIVTGRFGKPGVDWKRISPHSTLVVLMGVSQLPHIVRRLMAAGWSKRTPAIVIQHGTLRQQATAEGTLYDIVDRVRGAGVTSPATMVFGKVAALGRRLCWFR